MKKRIKMLEKLIEEIRNDKVYNKTLFGVCYNSGIDNAIYVIQQKINALERAND